MVASTRGSDKGTPSPIACVGCKQPLGNAAKQAPVFVRDDAGGQEAWCARCFFTVRAPMEPRRFAIRSIVAVHCSLCGWESVDFGQGRCAQCGSRFITVLPPTRKVVAAASHA
jgi:hypothetical protein